MVRSLPRGDEFASGEARWPSPISRHLSPFPANTGDVVKSYAKVLVPELNTGQLTMLLRARYLVDAECYAKVQGHPIGAAELEEAIRERL